MAPTVRRAPRLSPHPSTETVFRGKDMADFTGKYPLTISWLIIAMFLGVSGLAGCAEHFVGWDGVFGYVNSTYRQLVTAPITAVAQTLWPELLIKYPAWLADYIVVSAGLFVLVNVTWRDSMGKTLIADAFKDSGPIGGPIFLVFTFILTPVILPFVLFIYDSLNYEGKMQVRLQLKYYAFMAGVIVIMATINFSLKLF
jgi:hypothetical protein